MPFPPRVIPLRPASAVMAMVAVALSTGGCRKILGGSEFTSMGDIETNLEQLINPAKTGLNLQVSPRFATFGPVPNAAPWDSPVPAARTFEIQGQRLTFKTGSDGLIRERYEARACPLREIWSCVELWATGKFGQGNQGNQGKNDGQLACVGLRLEKGDTIEKRKLEMRTGDNCPFMTAVPGSAQQVVRGIEKAQLEHAQRQEADKYLDPKAQ